MSWFGGVRVAGVTGHAVDISELLAVDADGSRPWRAQVALLRCLHRPADPLACMVEAGVVDRAVAEPWRRCVAAVEGRAVMPMCKGEYERLSSALAEAAAPRGTASASPQHTAIEAECHDYLLRTLRAKDADHVAREWEYFLQCVVPRACDTEWRALQSCASQHRRLAQPLSQCVAEAQLVARCGNNYLNQR